MSTLLMAAALTMQVQWTPPAPPPPPPYQPSELERAFGYGESALEPAVMHSRCAVPIVDTDGWTACLRIEDFRPDPRLSEIHAAELAAKPRECVIETNDHLGRPMCAVRKP